MAATANATILEADHVTRYFGEGANRHLVLQELSLQICEGEIMAILGPSGSGKSTFLRALAGLSAPSEGIVRFRGVPQQGINPHIAIVFQSFALFPWLTVYQNVEVGLLNTDIPETQRRRRILEAIDVIGLDGFEDAFPKELSGGMRQRVGFARALVVQPEVLFMDEPFSALDVLTAENLKRELLSLWRTHKIPTQAIVMVTHNIDEAVAMGDRIVVMGRNPGTIRLDMPGLPLPERGKEQAEHVRLVDYLYSVMTNPEGKVTPYPPESVSPQKTQQDTGEGKEGPTPGALAEAEIRRSDSRTRPTHSTTAHQALPHVRVGQVTGLVERLHAQHDRADLYVLGRELQMAVDDLLPLVQAVDMLGLGDIDAGDVYLMPAGVRFAEGDILEEKQIFQTQARAHIQLIQEILRELANTPGRRLRREAMLQRLADSFNREEAERQLDTAIDWGRYAELFAYDDNEGIFTPESGEEL